MIESTSVQRSVLFADDEVLMHDIVTKGLSKIGCCVETASCGKEAMEKFHLRGAEFGVVVVDINMPKINGVEVVRKIKEACPEMYVVVASGYISGATKEALSALSRVCFLEKPYEINNLCDIVGRAFNH